MAHLAGFDFTDFSLPLVFEERYFIMEAGNPPLITVVMEIEGQPVFDILKNQPSANDVADIAIDPAGIVSVSDRTTGKLLYEVNPGYETSVIFRREDGGECPVVITDKEILVGGMMIENHPFRGSMGGVVIDPEIGAGMLGAPLPPRVDQWFA